MRVSDAIRNLFSWQPGRQGTGYEKMLLLANPIVVPFDFYLLRYCEGSEIPKHTDRVDGKRHYRLNIEVWRAKRGGHFRCDRPILTLPRVNLFRPDVAEHSVSRIEEGRRYVLSLGWVRN